MDEISSKYWKIYGRIGPEQSSASIGIYVLNLSKYWNIWGGNVLNRHDGVTYVAPKIAVFECPRASTDNAALEVLKVICKYMTTRTYAH
eukprot:2769879-Prymnesium_polylepis.1